MSNFSNNIPEHVKRQMGLVDEGVTGNETKETEEKIPSLEEIIKQQQVTIQPVAQEQSQEQEEEEGLGAFLKKQGKTGLEQKSTLERIMESQKFAEEVNESDNTVVNNTIVNNVNDNNISQNTETTNKVSEIKEGVVEKNPDLDFLDQIVVDLNNIEIVEKSPVFQQKDIETVLSKKSTYQVVALQSAYIAHMSALSFNDINAIKNSTADPYNSRKKFYDIIHSHIEDTSIGKLGRKDFLRVTSYHDLDTLLFGIYCQTYPKDSKFDITCGSCGKVNKITIDNETLIKVKPEKEKEVFERLEKIIYEVKDVDELVNKSLVHSKERIMLNNSKIIVDIYTPSLWDHLELLSNLNPRVAEQYEGTIGLMLFIKEMFMIDIEQTRKTGRPKYYPHIVTGKQIGRAHV